MLLSMLGKAVVGPGPGGGGRLCPTSPPQGLSQKQKMSWTLCNLTKAHVAMLQSKRFNRMPLDVPGGVLRFMVQPSPMGKRNAIPAGERGRID